MDHYKASRGPQSKQVPEGRQGGQRRASDTMMDANILSSIATQLMNAPEVQVGGRKLRVRRTSLHRLRSVTFEMNGREYMAIEQNASKPSYWGGLARKGHQVVQFKDVEVNRFVAVAVDGQVKEYSAMRQRDSSGTKP